MSSTNLWVILPDASGSAVDARSSDLGHCKCFPNVVDQYRFSKIQIRTIADHGLSDGDFVTLSGLIDVSEDTSFKVQKIDNDEIILSGINSTDNVRVSGVYLEA